MATQKKLSEIVCDAVKALQEPKGSRLKQIFTYAKEVTKNEEISLAKIKLALKNAIDNEMLCRTNDGRFNLNLPDVPNNDLKYTDVQDMAKDDVDLIVESCCPKRRRRRSCRRRRKSCRRRRRSCRRKRPCRRRRRSCKPKRRRRCCTKMWVPKRRRCCR